MSPTPATNKVELLGEVVAPVAQLSVRGGAPASSLVLCVERADRPLGTLAIRVRAFGERARRCLSLAEGERVHVRGRLEEDPAEGLYVVAEQIEAEALTAPTPRGAPRAA